MPTPRFMQAPTRYADVAFVSKHAERQESNFISGITRLPLNLA